MKMSPVFSSGVPSAESGGVIREKSSSVLPSSALNVRSRWFGSLDPSLLSSYDTRLEFMSRTRLLREPEERNDRMGGMTGRLDVAVVMLGARNDTGGRDLRLSSVLVFWTDLGSSSSRCLCAQSFVALSGRLEGVKAGSLPAGVPFESGSDCGGAAWRRELLVGFALAEVATAVGESGKDAGRFEADDGVKGLARGVV